MPETTEAAEESPVRAPLPTATFLAAVVRVQDLGHPFRRITFRGADLARFRSVGADQFVYLLLPPPGRTELTIDASFTWDQYRTMPESDRPVGAYYTVRHHRPIEGEIDIDVVIHDAPGVGSDWAKRAAIGDPVALWGPRTAYAPPEGSARQMLIGDETAVPAIGAILDALPVGFAATIVLELDARTELALRVAEEIAILRVDRPRAGVPGALLVDAVKAHPLDAATYVWAGGEFEAMSAIRQHLRRERALPPPMVSVVGYWRAGEPS